LKGASKLKIPGGKLISIKLEYSSTIDDIQILGDFFLHPEESLQKIEKGLVGMPVRSGKVAMEQRIKAIAEENGIEMMGITPQAICKAIEMAVQ
jgi:lipoate-protein ligase A